MNFTILLLPFLLTTRFPSNVTSSNILKSEHGNESINDGFWTKTLPINVDFKLSFLELDEDILHLIIEELNLIDLINAAKVNRKISSIATNVFYRRFLNYIVEINRDDEDDCEIYDIFLLEKRLKIYNYKLSLNLLRHFMCVIQKLVIKNELLGSGQSAIINRLVNEHSTHRMTSLNLGTLKEDTLAQFTTPFEAVEDFECTIEVKSVGANILLFNVLLPRLRRFILRLKCAVDFSYIECEYPYLEYFDIIVFYDAWKQKNSIEGLIRKNPQIQNFISYGLPSNYANELNKLLPNLVSLTLHGLDAGNDTVRFENVKHFRSVVVSPIAVDNVFFPRLESLFFHYSTSSLNTWIAFLDRHQHLMKLHVNEYFHTGRVQLGELANQLGNLVEMSMECCSFISAEELTSFIENHPKLMKFQFSVLDFKRDQSVIRIIRERFEKEWNVKEFDGDQYGLALERKVLMV